MVPKFISWFILDNKISTTCDLRLECIILRRLKLSYRLKCLTNLNISSDLSYCFYRANEFKPVTT